MSRRLYVPIVVDYYRDTAVVEACADSPWCEVLWVRLLAEVKDRETDGVITPAIAAVTGVPSWRKRIATLVRVGLLVEDDNGWKVRSWTAHNLTVEQVARRREETAERVRKHREKRGESTPGNTVGNAPKDALPLSSKPEAVSSYVVPSPHNGGCARADGGGTTSAAIKLLARQELADAQRLADNGNAPHIGNVTGWLAAKERSLHEVHGHELAGIAGAPEQIITEWRRRQRATKALAGARTWGETRATSGLDRDDVEHQAQRQWPDLPEAIAAALAAYDATANPPRTPLRSVKP